MSGLSNGETSKSGVNAQAPELIPGQICTAAGMIELNRGRETITVVIHNTGDRPIQVGSHFHIAEVNRFLEFDRNTARGFRLNIPSGTSVRFEPGVHREVSLVALGGNAVVPGLQIKPGTPLT